METLTETFRCSVDTLQKWSTYPYFYQLAAALALLACLLFLYIHWRRRHRGIEPFRSEGGRIEIAPHTVRSIVQYAAKGVHGVEYAQCHLYPGRRLRVDIAIHLIASARLREVDTEIKERVRSALKQQFGIEQVSPINIRVKKLIGDPVIDRPRQTPAREPIETHEEEASGFDELPANTHRE